MASGHINQDNIRKFLKREICMAIMMALILGSVAFARAYFTEGSFFWGNLAISLSLSLIVLMSVILGSCMPLALEKIRLDPAFAAGPFLATLMDIFGLLIYCYVSKLLLG
jgi:magnesium transporter